MVNEFNYELVNSYIKENNISKTEFCKLCGICPNSLRRLYNNDNYHLLTLFKVARVIGVRCSELIKEK